MGYHNDTCGCPRCFHINYPHRVNPHGGGINYRQPATRNCAPSQSFHSASHSAVYGYILCLINEINSAKTTRRKRQEAK